MSDLLNDQEVDDNLLQTSQFTEVPHKKTIPKIYNTSTMPKINCFYHQGQIVTNFCKCEECLLPLCPECVQEHINEHKETKSYPSMESLEKVLSEISVEIASQSNDLGQSYQEIQKSLSQAVLQNEATIKKLKDVRERIVRVIDQHFNSLENELKNKQQKNLEHFNRDANSLSELIKKRWKSHIVFLENLSKPECMYSVLPYLQSNVIQDNQFYQQVTFDFANRYKEVQSTITFDSFKASNLNTQLLQIIQLINKDLTEFIDIHKLAPTDILKSRILQVKSTNNQKQIGLNQQKIEKLVQSTSATKIISPKPQQDQQQQYYEQTYSRQQLMGTIPFQQQSQQIQQQQSIIHQHQQMQQSQPPQQYNSYIPNQIQPKYSTQQQFYQNPQSQLQPFNPFQQSLYSSAQAVQQQYINNDLQKYY